MDIEAYGTEQQGGEIGIFCCYAHKDKRLLDQLKKHLSSLQRRKVIHVWDDGDITPGTEWGPEIKKHLNEAKIILLLISPDFINSDYCYSTEMQQALVRHKRGDAKVIPVLLCPVHGWEMIPPGDIQLGSLQALPTAARPVTSWTNRNEAWKNVARGIEEAINELLRGVPVPPPVDSSQEQASMCYLPIASSPTKGAATLKGSTIQHDGWWSNRVTRLVILAITLALGVSIAALVGNQVFNLPPSPGATITFDALGGSSNVIEVYPGVGNTLQDKTYNGRYYSGETVPIVCETKGRTVTSNPAAGEQYRQSDEWYKLQTLSGTQPEYATAVYADKHGSVPQC